MKEKIKTLVFAFTIILLITSCNDKKKIAENTKENKSEMSETMSTIKIKADMSVNSDRIFPRIKANYGHEIYKDDLKQKFMGNSENKIDIPQKFLPISVSLFEDINLTFIADKGADYQILQNEVLDMNPNLTIDSLKSSSIQNLMKEIGDKIEMRGDVDDIGMLTCGGNFEATIIFIGGTWEHLYKLFGTEIAFCIPANDIFYVCKADNKIAISKMKTQINEWFHSDNTQGLISKAIYLKIKDKPGVKIMDTAF